MTAISSSDIVLKVQILNRGLYRITTNTLDRMMAKYLPDSVWGLCDLIDKRWREDLGRMDGMNPAREDIHTVTEALFVLAELDGYGL